MIKTEKVCKQFDQVKAVEQVSVTIREGNVFGLIGTNGAGKSTFMRMLSGILRPDRGTITIDDMEVYENIQAKQLFFYISDDQYYFSNTIPKDLKKFYGKCYPDFDGGRFDQLMDQFDLDPKRKLNTYSKGMKKQVSMICSLCANTKYIFCDETFDGLDPVMRQAVKSLIAKEVSERNLTPVIASHNLRELEDICDSIGLLHKGGILLSKELIDMKQNIHKIQCVFQKDQHVEDISEKLEVMKREKRGSLYTFTMRGSQKEIIKLFKSVDPIFFEVLPLSLEEIFISETEVAGYDIKKLIL